MFSLLLFGMDEKIFGKLRTMGRTNKGRPYVSFHRNCALGGGVHECSTGTFRICIGWGEIMMCTAVRLIVSKPQTTR